MERPNRPAHCHYDSISTLYAVFEQIFLAEGGRLQSACGHSILLFDHHFFHLAAINADGGRRLFMAEEKSEIQSTTSGFGKYILSHNGARANNLPSAKDTMADPDEVWEQNPRAKSATWIYVKEYQSTPYAFTVAFLTVRPSEGNIIVPVSSFPCKRGDAKKWRCGKLVYQKHVQPPHGG
jgi:hypothetical protein